MGIKREAFLLDVLLTFTFNLDLTCYSKDIFYFLDVGCCVVQWWRYQKWPEKSLILGYHHRRGRTPGRLCTQAVYTRPTQDIFTQKEPKTWTPSTTHYQKKYNKNLQVDSEIQFKYKTIKWIRSRMASYFLVKLNFNELGKEQMDVILNYIIKEISSPWEENAKPFC